nr:MAG TPA_asm: hypothetical protein [Caudoviricetes sp.]
MLFCLFSRRCINICINTNKKGAIPCRVAPFQTNT